MPDIALIAIAAFFAGILNAAAGGGSFLTFPSLVAIGIPPIAANATSTLAVFPGYLSSALGFVEELKAVNRKYLYQLIILAAIGGVSGALLLLITTDELFRNIIPWLLLVATILFAFGDRLTSNMAETTNRPEKKQHFATLAVTTYGGYFNGGVGIILLALLSSMGFKDLNLMNGLKNTASFVLSAASVLTFTIAGIVHWYEASIMMVTATLGGYIGARLMRQVPRQIMKWVIVLIGAVITAAFFIYG